MGVDWVRMRLKADANLQEIKELIDLQRFCFPNGALSQVLTQIAPNNPDLVPLAEKDEIYTKSCKSLQQLLEFEDYPPSDFPDLGLSWRVSVITQNCIFPLEWRRDAYRTFLPETLPKQLEIWKSYDSAVKQGKFKDYLLNLYLYEHTYEFYEQWKYLKEYTELSLGRSNSWATKPDFLAIRERILNFPVPYRHPAPVWSESESQNNYNYSENKYIYELVCKQTDEYRQLHRGWNSRVPKNWKNYYLVRKCNFEEFIDLGSSDWLCDFFTWVERCCSKNMGLFLDY